MYLTHRCRFVEFNPSGITCLSFSKPNQPSKNPAKGVKLACARENGNIEIWSPSLNWLLEKTIHGNSDYSIESLAWIQDNSRSSSGINRLFSSGLDGVIREWDQTSLRIKFEIHSNGGAIWCMAASHDNQFLAIGCEDGCVRLFRVVPCGDFNDFDDMDFALPTLEYVRSFDKMDGRILSVAWGKSDDYIVTGSSDGCIRKMNVDTGRLLHRATLDKSQEETLVWSVLVLDDGQIVSGDSMGSVCFWDPNTFSLAKSSKVHEADVLCLAADSLGRTVYSAGIDRAIIRHESVKDKNSFKWVHAGSRHYHSHDIRSLALLDIAKDPILISGGVDCTLVVASDLKAFPSVKLNRMSPFPLNEIIHLAHNSNLMLTQFSQSLQLWRLGSVSGEATEFKVQSKVPLDHPNQLLADIKMKCKTNIVTSAISSAGHWIAVSDSLQTKLFRVDVDSLSISKIDLDVTPAATNIQFTPDEKRIILTCFDSRVYVVDILDDGFQVSAVFDHHIVKERRSLLVNLQVSADGVWLASGDDCNRINIFNLDSLKHHMQLPMFSGRHVAFTFNPHLNNEIAIATTNNEFYLFDLESKKLNDWSRQNSHKLPEKFLQRKETIRGLFFLKNPGYFAVWGTTYLTIVNLTLPIENQCSIKKTSRKQPLTKNIENLKLTHTFSPALYISCNYNGDLVTVERPLFSMMESLPPRLSKKTFGS